MQIISDKNEIVFRKDFNGKTTYSIGLTKTDAKNNFVHGYIKANFKKGVDLSNKTRIKIKDAWLSFYLDNGKTRPTIFVNEYEIVKDGEEYQNQEEKDPYKEMSVKVESDIGKDIKIEDSELPF